MRSTEPLPIRLVADCQRIGGLRQGLSILGEGGEIELNRPRSRGRPRPREPVSIETEDENEYDDEQVFAGRYAEN
jgi:hypothetical protein